MFTPPKPRFRDFFSQDLYNNLTNRSEQGTKPLYKPTVMKEWFMYSCDMCLEFQRKSEGLLTTDWIEHITREVGEALLSIMPGDLTESDFRIAVDKVQQLMKFPEAALQKEVDKYYNRL